MIAILFVSQIAIITGIINSLRNNTIDIYTILGIIFTVILFVAIIVFTKIVISEIKKDE